MAPPVRHPRLALTDDELKELEWCMMASPLAVDRRSAPHPWLNPAQQRLIDAGFVSVRETGPGDAVLILEVTDAGRQWLASSRT